MNPQSRDIMEKYRTVVYGLDGCGFDPKFVSFLNQKIFLTSSVSFVSGKREMIIESVTKMGESQNHRIV